MIHRNGPKEKKKPEEKKKNINNDMHTKGSRGIFRGSKQTSSKQKKNTANRRHHNTKTHNDTERHPVKVMFRLKCLRTTANADFLCIQGLWCVYLDIHIFTWKSLMQYHHFLGRMYQDSLLAWRCLQAQTRFQVLCNHSKSRAPYLASGVCRRFLVCLSHVSLLCVSLSRKAD